MKRLEQQDGVVPRSTTRAREEAARETAARRPASRVRGRSLAVVAAAGIGACAGAAFLHRWAVTTPGLAVRTIRVEGALHASVDEIAAVSDASGRNVLGLDLDAVRERVLAHPWVATATVRRDLPQALRITIVERVPTAVVEMTGVSTLVDASGDVIAVAGAAAGLPAITGLDELPPGERDAARVRVARTLAAVRDKAPQFFETISSAEAGSSDRVVIHAPGHPPIWLAGPESADELAGYAARWRGIRASIGPVSRVDARWRDRLFVMPVDATQ